MPLFIFAVIALLIGVPAVSYWLDKCFEAPASKSTALARVGASASDYFERNLGAFNWEKYRALVVAMYRYPAQRARGIALLNRRYPGKGNALASGLSLVESGVQNNPVAILQIQSIAEQAKAGSAEMAAPFQMLRVINAARKAALTAATTRSGEPEFQDEVARLEMEPAETFEENPYAMMKW